MGEYDAVSAARRFAALAAQIADLHTQVGNLATAAAEASQQRELDQRDVAAVKTALAQWNARLEVEGIGPTLAIRRDIKKLREDLDRLRAEVVGLSDAVKDAIDGGKTKAPAAPDWNDMDPDTRATQLAALREWANGFLRVQYPEYPLPACWEDHPAALWELGNIHAEWTRIYTSPRGAKLEDTLWFHERWLPGALARLDQAIRTSSGCREHGYSASMTALPRPAWQPPAPAERPPRT